MLRKHGTVILAPYFQNCFVHPNEVAIDFKTYITRALCLINAKSIKLTMKTIKKEKGFGLPGR